MVYQGMEGRSDLLWESLSLAAYYDDTLESYCDHARVEGFSAAYSDRHTQT